MNVYTNLCYKMKKLFDFPVLDLSAVKIIGDIFCIKTKEPYRYIGLVWLLFSISYLLFVNVYFLVLLAQFKIIQSITFYFWYNIYFITLRFILEYITTN